jgi:hypothetical protein
VRRRQGVLLLAAAVLVAGCSSADDGDPDAGPDAGQAATSTPASATPSETGSPTTSATPSPSATPDDDFAVEREVVLAAVQSQVTGPPGVEPTAVCDSVVDDEPCFEDSAGAEWLVGGGVLGRPVPRGNGIRETAYVAVARWTDPAAQQAWVETYTQRNVTRYDGAFDIAVESLPGGGFEPGQRGQGTTETVEVDGWVGEVADLEHVLLFEDPPTSARRVVRSYVLSRGEHTLLFYTAANSQARSAAFDRGLADVLDFLEKGTR